MFMRGMVVPGNIYGAVAPIIVQFDLLLHPVVFFLVSFGAFVGLIDIA
jgi:hypothetical protein